MVILVTALFCINASLPMPVTGAPSIMLGISISVSVPLYPVIVTSELLFVYSKPSSVV